MAFRIFDTVLSNRTWSATGRLCIAHEPQTVSCGAVSAEAQLDSLCGRLLLRSKSDRIICRAARQLVTNPSMPLDVLARSLGTTERYLLSGLRAALGTDPQQLVAALRRRRHADGGTSQP
jgi:hypothetical protein